MNQPYRTPGIVVAAEAVKEKSVKSSSWKYGNLRLRWDYESGYMEVGVAASEVHDAVAWARIDDTVAYEFAEMLNTAASDI